jgi:hypothetical protein
VSFAERVAEHPSPGVADPDATPLVIAGRPPPFVDQRRHVQPKAVFGPIGQFLAIIRTSFVNIVGDVHEILSEPSAYPTVKEVALCADRRNR